MKVIIESSPQEIAEILIKQEEVKKPLFASDIDFNYLCGALKDFGKCNKAKQEEPEKNTVKAEPPVESELSKKTREEFASNAKKNALVERIVREMERTTFTASEAVDFLDRLKNAIKNRTVKKSVDELF